MNTEKKNNLLLNSLSTPLNELVFSIIQTDVNPDQSFVSLQFKKTANHHFFSVLQLVNFRQLIGSTVSWLFILFHVYLFYELGHLNIYLPQDRSFVIFKTVTVNFLLVHVLLVFDLLLFCFCYCYIIFGFGLFVFFVCLHFVLIFLQNNRSTRQKCQLEPHHTGNCDKSTFPFLNLCIQFLFFVISLVLVQFTVRASKVT